MKQLPNKPSELIRLALSDLEECEQDPKYAVDMGSWHRPVGAQCLVCLAGSVMAKTMKVPQHNFETPDNHVEFRKLRFLNDIRSGDGTYQDAAAVALNRGMCKPSVSFDLPAYVSYNILNPDAFKARLRYIADMYEKGGA